ncbi:hypothetical protein NQ317_003824 [Molorchus minor]|uniref:Uncharacterized protein n=1 Tax=Molorchus minor TaxID=1323400 RepID=A0ABQ9JCY3_9CUCU|nr:hypothetical protein NQ317_003824 [Molorchus minor]
MNKPSSTLTTGNVGVNIVKMLGINKWISIETLKLMEPEDFIPNFIPKIGDRLAILDFCSRETNFKK